MCVCVCVCVCIYIYIYIGLECCLIKRDIFAGARVEAARSRDPPARDLKNKVCNVTLENLEPPLNQHYAAVDIYVYIHIYIYIHILTYIYTHIYIYVRRCLAQQC